MVEEAVAGVQFLDLVGELEALEDAPRGGREAVDVGDQVGRDVLGVAEEASKGVGTDVIERVLAVRVCGLAEQPIHGRRGHLLGLQFAASLENGILGRFQHAVEPAQDDHGEHHQAILRRAVGSPKPVSDLPDLGLQLLVRLNVQQWLSLFLTVATVGSLLFSY